MLAHQDNSSAATGARPRYRSHSDEILELTARFAAVDRLRELSEIAAKAAAELATAEPNALPEWGHYAEGYAGGFASRASLAVASVVEWARAARSSEAAS